MGLDLSVGFDGAEPVVVVLVGRIVDVDMFLGNIHMQSGEVSYTYLERDYGIEIIGDYAVAEDQLSMRTSKLEWTYIHESQVVGGFDSRHWCWNSSSSPIQWFRHISP